MEGINLTALLERYKLSKAEIAALLFPDNKHAVLALNRVLIGKSLLNEKQISKLAAFCGLAISDLYQPRTWKNKRKNGVYVFTSDSFRAELDSTDWTTKVFHNDSLFHTEVISAPDTPLSEYFSILNSIIIKFQEND